MTSAFDAFVRDLHQHRSADPNRRVELGIDGDFGELPDPSIAHLDASVAEARQLLERARALDPAALSPDEAIDRELAILLLDGAVLRDTLRIDGERQHARMPRAADELGDPILMLLTADPRPSADRLDDITRRLAAAPEYLEAMRARLTEPVAQWVRMEVAQLGGFPELVQAAVDLVEQSDWSGRARLAQARDDAEAAVARYQASLESLPTIETFSVGADAAARLVATSGVDLSLSELHALSRRFLARTQEQLAQLRDRLAPRYGLAADVDFATLHDTLKTRFAVDIGDRDPVQAILARYDEERARIDAFNREHQLFERPADEALELVPTPSFLQPVIPAGAMLPPAPFRAGRRESLVYLTLTPGEIPNHHELGIPTMMVHEGVPGHHLQLAWAACHPSVVRRHFGAPSHAEGWTTMLEDYVLDLGYMGELTDEARFIGHRDLARIGARVAIDLAFMTGDPAYLQVGVPCELSGEQLWDDAAALLMAVTGFSAGRTQGELSWYSRERAYPLSYLAGNEMVWTLKRDLSAANPERDPRDLDREFHRIYLTEGNLTLPLLRRVFERQGLL